MPKDRHGVLKLAWCSEELLQELCYGFTGLVSGGVFLVLKGWRIFKIPSVAFVFKLFMA